jgi:uncharacterized protein YebE (UPF0316 family)
MLKVLIDSAGISGFDWYAWVILPIIVFFARICDVTLGTLRIILMARGKNRLSPLLGFFEVLVWIVVIGQLVQNIHSITAYLGYAGGFAAGNYVGMWLENRLALGTYIVRVILPHKADELIEKIHNAGFGVTSVEGEGAIGPVKLVYTVVKRKQVDLVLTLIHETVPNAFVTIEEIRSTEKGVFDSRMHTFGSDLLGKKSK